MTNYVISQIFVCISYAFLMATYFIKDYKSVLLFNLASIVFLASGYAFLNAVSGFASSCISTARNIALYIHFLITKNNNQNKMSIFKIVVFVIITIVTIVVAIFTYENAFSLLPIVATVLFTYGICQNSSLIYKILGVPVSILWLIYNIFVFSLFGIILESITLVCVIAGLIIYLVNRHKTVNKP